MADAKQPQPRPKRRFWQIHVCTAGVVMLVVSTLVYANLKVESIQHVSSWAVDENGKYGKTSHFGWPKVAHWVYEPTNRVSTADDSHWNWGLIVTNAAICLSILIVTTTVVECFIRCLPRLPRRWFQIHLSTLVIVSIETGVLMWANLPRKFTPPVEYESSPTANWTFPELAQGWPWAFGMFLKSDGTDYHRVDGWLWRISLDVTVAVVILLVTMGVCEHLIRRRKSQQ